MLHREMTAALTTASVINHSMNPYEQPVNWTMFAPSHRDNLKAKTAEREPTEEQKKQISEYNLRVLEMAAKMKDGNA